MSLRLFDLLGRLFPRKRTRALVMLRRPPLGGASGPLVNQAGSIVRMPFSITPDELLDVSSYFAKPSVAGAVFGVTDPLLAAPLSRFHVLHFPYLGALYGTLSREGLAMVRNHPSVKEVYDPPTIELISAVSSEPIDTPPTGPTWGIARLGIPDLWSQGHTGSGITIAHLDTGLDASHPILSGALARHVTTQQDGQILQPESPASDTEQHGTHTAATLVGRRAANGACVGVAPDAKVMDATVVEGGDTVARMLAGMNWALQYGARVLNMSAGVWGYSDAFTAILDRLREQELLPVMAIGNEGAKHTRSPANYPTVLSVGATDQADSIASFSGSYRVGGPAVGPTLCAPGVDVISAAPGGAYQLMRGTSMATPHVAGLAALLLSARPDASIAQVQDAILASCALPASADPIRCGRGIPAAVEALNHLVHA